MRSTTQRARPSPGAVPGLPPRDLRVDAGTTKLAAVRVVVVPTIGRDALRSSARTAGLAARRRDTLDKQDQLRDVVAVAARHRPGERDPGRVYEKVMLEPEKAP